MSTFVVVLVERGSLERRLTSVPTLTLRTGKLSLTSPGWKTPCLGTLCREVSNGLAHVFLKCFTFEKGSRATIARLCIGEQLIYVVAPSLKMLHH